MSQVNENQAYRYTVASLDYNGKARTPTNARYRLDDKLSGNSIIAWTDISPLSTSMTIDIPASANAIIDSNQEFETKVLTVEVDYGTNDASNTEVEYEVKNQQFLS